MIEIQLGVIAIINLISLWVFIKINESANVIVDHLKGIDAKTITAVADEGCSLSRSDEVEYEIEQNMLKEHGKQTFS